MARPANESALPFPPYGSFISFLNDLNAMEVLPNQLNQQVFSSSYSGSAKHQILKAFRFFGLMSEAGVPDEKQLRPLMEPATRQLSMGAILQEAYKALIDLPLETAGPAEVNTWFNSIGMDSATTRKAKSFFLAAAKENGIKMHSLVADKTRKSPAGTRRKRKPKPGTQILPDPGNPEPQDPRRDGILFHPAIDAFLREARKLTGQDTWTQANRDLLIQGFTAQLDIFLPVKPKGRAPRSESAPKSNGAAES